MKAKIKETGEIVDVYHEPQHGQIINIYKESVFVNGRIWTEDELIFLDTIEVKEVDLDKIARYYLLHEHKSPLNEVLHQADLNTEMQYHKDIENAYKAGVEFGLKAQKGE